MPSSTLALALPTAPTAPALFAEHGTYTFGDLASRSVQYALVLARLGARKGAHIGLLLPNCPDWLAIAWGAWRLGAVVVPLNTFWTASELMRGLDVADVHLLVATTRFLKNDYTRALEAAGITVARHQTRAETLPCLHTIVWFPSAPRPDALSWQEQCSFDVSPAELHWLLAMQEQVTGTDPAAIFFTSGSEAEPKAVVHTHASILAAARGIGERLGLERTDRVWAYLPWFFAGGLVAGVVAPWLHGAAVICQEVFDAGKAIALMERYQATTFFAWPHQAQAIIQHADFARARIRLSKGPGAQADWAEALYGFEHRAVSAWGMTETGPMASTSSWSDPIEKRKTTHGRPLPGVEMKIVDPVTGEDLPPGCEGELVVRGETLMLGYYGRRHTTCFDQHDFFHTGDRAWIDADGYLHFVGRIRDVIKTAGASVSPAEVEAVLAAHPGVHVAAVVGAPDPERGQCVIAFVVSRPQAFIDRDTLLSWCRERLASYKVPKHIFFLDEAELPILGSGKIDKAALINLARQFLASVD